MLLARIPSPDRTIGRNPNPAGERFEAPTPRNALWSRIATSAPRRLPAGERIQAKLLVNRAGDAHEQEADRVADRVMGMPEPSSGSALAVSSRRSGVDIQRACPSCEDEVQRAAIGDEEDEDEPALQRKATSSAAPDVERPAAPRFGALPDGGRPLPRAALNFFESRFGRDFGHVRIHADAGAAELSRGIDARAFTHGRDVYFGAGQYRPDEPEGRRLLAHELTHVVQQASEPGRNAGAGSARSAAPRVQRKAAVKHIGIVDRILFYHDLRTGANQHVGLRPGWEVKAQTPREMVIDLIAAFRGAKRYFDERAWKAPGEIKGYSRDALVSIPARLPPRSPGALAFQLNVWNRMYRAAHELIVEELNAQPGLTESLNTAYREAVLALEAIKVTSRRESFERALAEGGEVMGKAGFGRSCGTPGAGASDSYDASSWEEVVETLTVAAPGEKPTTARGSRLRAKGEPWSAATRLFNSLGKDVPRAGGGTTKWSFDCREAVTVGRIYAHWRTLSRDEFNQRFAPLEIPGAGGSALVENEWEPSIVAMNPTEAEAPYTRKEGELVLKSDGTYGLEESRIPAAASMDALVKTAPIGSWILFSNLNATERCSKDASLPFCESWMAEHTVKVGPDRFAAHNLGIVGERHIRRALAREVLRYDLKREPTDAETDAYVKQYIFVSMLRFPKPGPK
jgi:hypothetical protein